MGKNLSPKCKQCRRTDEKLFLKGDRCSSAKCAMVKRNYPPGFHGPRGRRQRLSDYGLQLNEKQKAKKQYNMLEKQFKLTFEKAKQKSGNTGDNFLKLLETRLDNTIYRLGFADSRPQARQLINHGLFSVNDTRVDIPSYQVKIGDVIKIKSNKKNVKIFTNLAERIQKKEIPGWMDFDNKTMKGKILHQPDTQAIKSNFNMQMVVEFYSR
ncbi:30S ribosomal protein S4 [Patescibacteria group bacterium]